MVEALRSLRGVDAVVATTLVAEIGDIGRFDNARQLIRGLMNEVRRQAPGVDVSVRLTMLKGVASGFYRPWETVLPVLDRRELDLRRDPA